MNLLGALACVGQPSRTAERARHGQCRVASTERKFGSCTEPPTPRGQTSFAGPVQPGRASPRGPPGAVVAEPRGPRDARGEEGPRRPWGRASHGLPAAGKRDPSLCAGMWGRVRGSSCPSLTGLLRRRPPAIRASARPSSEASGGGVRPNGGSHLSSVSRRPRWEGRGAAGLEADDGVEGAAEAETAAARDVSVDRRRVRRSAQKTVVFYRSHSTARDSSIASKGSARTAESSSKVSSSIQRPPSSR